MNGEEELELLDLCDLVEQIRDGLEECLEPGLSHQDLIGRVKELYDSLPDEDDDEGDDEGDDDEDDTEGED